MTRALSASQANTCENAKTPPARCRCRCGGALHGAARAVGDELEKLPADDPHAVKPPSALELRRRAIAGDAPRDSSDPWALLEEVDDPRDLPTVGEWLEAGGPMREVDS